MINQPVSYMLPGFSHALAGSWKNTLILFYLGLFLVEKEAIGMNHFLNSGVELSILVLLA